MNSNQTQGFLRAVLSETRLVDACLLAVVPVVLIAIVQLPTSLREQYVFRIADPTLTAAYASHFIHLREFHLVGNLAIYLVVAPVTYLLCALSARRQLFRISLITLLAAFPLALSSMQLVFPREREILGFSGLNAGLFGLLCLALVIYVSHNITKQAFEIYAPSLLFLTLGMIALISLPARAWRTEIALASFGIGVSYIGTALRANGLPNLSAVKRSFDRPGYTELAGFGFGLVFAYPFVGFREVVVVGEGVVDVYIHLLGYSLAFIVVFVFVFVTKEEGSTADW